MQAGTVRNCTYSLQDRRFLYFSNFLHFQMSVVDFEDNLAYGIIEKYPFLITSHLGILFYSITKAFIDNNGIMFEIADLN